MIERVNFSPYVSTSPTNGIKASKGIQYGFKDNTAFDTVSFGASKDISIVGKKFKDKIKIIFSDIDGTISPHSDIMSKKVISAIDSLQEKNVPVILTTARCFRDTLPISEQFKKMPDFTIVLQGGKILDKNGKTIFEDKIPQKSGVDMIDWFNTNFKKDQNTHLITYFNDTAFCESGFQFPWDTRYPIQKTDSYYKLFKENNVLQKAIVYKTDGDLADKSKTAASPIMTSFQDANIDNLTMNSSGYCFFEIQNANASKDKAIDVVLKTIGIKPKNAMVIGDSSNDIEMLDFINAKNGLAVAMGDASDDVKIHAGAITSNIEQDGFYNAIKQVFSNI